MACKMTKPLAIAQLSIVPRTIGPVEFTSAFDPHHNALSFRRRPRAHASFGGGLGWRLAAQNTEIVGATWHSSYESLRLALEKEAKSYDLGLAHWR